MANQDFNGSVFNLRVTDSLASVSTKAKKILLTTFTLCWLTLQPVSGWGNIGDIFKPNYEDLFVPQDPNAVSSSSSVYGTYSRHSQAVDSRIGDSNVDDFKKYCFASSWESNPWWSLTYDKIKVLHSLTIYNRGDCCGERLHDFDVYVSVDTNNPETSTDKVLCKHHTGKADDEDIIKVSCDEPLEGLHVIITIPGSREMLSFCEVYIKNTDLDTSNNIALSRPTYQSEQLGNGDSFHAVDGHMGSNYGEGCTETPYQADPWWSVGFEDIKQVRYMYITNRGNCCSYRLHDFDVYIMSDSNDPTMSYDKQLCAHYDGTVGSGATVKIVCEEPIYGLYVAIQILGNNEQLTVCEVQVIGDTYDIDESIFLTIFNALQNDLQQMITLNEEYKFLLPAAKHLCLKGSTEYCDLETVLYQLQILAGYSLSTNVHKVRSMIEFKEVSLTTYLDELKQSKDFHSLLLNVQFGLNTVIDVTEEVSKDLGDYFGALASYDTQIAEADVTFITTRLDELKTGSNALWSISQHRITRIVDTAITLLSMEVAEKTAQLMVQIAQCFNPIAIITGGCDFNDIADRLADLTSAIRRLAKATTLADGLNSLYKAVSSLIEKFTKNKQQLIAIQKIVDEFSTMTNEEKIAASQDFITAYADYTPYVTDQDLARIAAALEMTASAGCDLIEGAGGSVAKVAGTVMEEVNEDCLKIAPELAELDSYYNDWYTFQFELIDSFSIIVRGYIRSSYAERLTSISTRIDIKDGVIGFIMGELLYQKVATSLCNFIEYRDGGTRPDICETSYFTDSQVQQLIAYNIPQLDSSIQKTVYIPSLPEYEGDVNYINVTQLLDGNTLNFKAPIDDETWLIDHKWLSKDFDAESSFFVLGMNLFIPGLKCQYEHGIFEASVEATSHESARYYRGADDGISYIIPKLSLKFQYKEMSNYCNINQQDYLPVKDNNDSTVKDIATICINSNGLISECDHTFAPSLFSSWSFKLRQDVCTIEKNTSYPFTPMITAKLQVHEIKTDINECWPNPCVNGGTCTDGKLQYKCTCMEGYGGTNCEMITLIGTDSILVTSQSSTSGTGYSSYGADGILDGDCTSTAYEKSSWWSVHINARAVYSVEITNGNPFSFFNIAMRNTVYISSESNNPNTSPNKQKCGDYDSTVSRGTTVTVDCVEPYYGSYVIIQASGIGQFIAVSLSVCEATMRGYDLSNIALLKPTEQSSVEDQGSSRKAVDDNSGTDHTKDGCTQTEAEENPWWSVLLGDEVTVYALDVTNRRDCCSSRLHDFDVYVTYNQTLLTSDQLCAHYTGAVGAGQTQEIVCTKPLQGQYVVIMIPGTEEVLQLCEVKVYGTDW